MSKPHCYKESLQKEGLKSTKRRTSILEMLENSSQPLSAEDIFLRLKESEVSINISTVYRILETLTARGFLLKNTIMGDVRSLYELNRHEHKHHFVCLGCKLVIPISGCPLHAYEKVLQEQMGCEIQGHKLELFGYCSACRLKPSK